MLIFENHNNSNRVLVLRAYSCITRPRRGQNLRYAAGSYGFSIFETIIRFFSCIKMDVLSNICTQNNVWYSKFRTWILYLTRLKIATFIATTLPLKDMIYFWNSVMFLHNFLAVEIRSWGDFKNEFKFIYVWSLDVPLISELVVRLWMWPSGHFTLQARFACLAVTQRNKLLTLVLNCFCVLDFFMLHETQKDKQIEKVVVACGCTYWFVFEV